MGFVLNDDRYLNVWLSRIRRMIRHMTFQTEYTQFRIGEPH